MNEEQNFLSHRLSQRLNFSFVNNDKVQKILSEIDTLNGQWKYSVSLSPQILNKLEHSAIVSSTGASTRIEGSKLSDKRVDVWLQN
jgi:hypothetical protein